MFTQQLNLGQFFQADGELHGTLSALAMATISVISKTMVDREGKTYLKLIGDPLGAAFEIGVAFPKDKDGKPYYSVTLESPVFPSPIRAALFPDRNNQTIHNLIWTRPETTALSSEAKVTNGPTQQRRHARATTSP